MIDHRTKIVLLHIMEDLRDIETFISKSTLLEFSENALVKKAVCMSLLNIGEMIALIPEELKNLNPEIPWRSIIGLRNRTAHGYHSLDYTIIWEIAKNDLASLKRCVINELKKI